MRHGNIRIGTAKKIFVMPEDPLPAFVVVGGSGTTPHYSFDGISWAAGSGSPTSTIYSGAYGNGTFIFGGGGTSILRSTDGMNFSPVTVPSGNIGASAANAMVYWAKYNVFVFLKNSSVYTSDDNGLTWVRQLTIPNLLSTPNSLILSGNGEFLYTYSTVIGTTTYQAAIHKATSPSSWAVAHSVSGLTEPPNKIGPIGDNGVLILSGGNNAIPATRIISLNGTTFSTLAETFYTGNLNLAFGYIPGLKRTVYGMRGSTASPYNLMAYTDNGTTWTRVLPSVLYSPSNSNQRIAWSNRSKILLNINTNATAYVNSTISPDGETWTTYSNGFPNVMTALIGY